MNAVLRWVVRHRREILIVLGALIDQLGRPKRPR